MRSILFEFEDQKWFPNIIRQSMTDYLRYYLHFTNFYRPTTALLAECIRQTGGHQCIDLCSGGGGAVESVVKNLRKDEGIDARFVLTDKFPNLEAFSFLRERLPFNVDFSQTPVDATQVPANLDGVRTIYSAIHHFDPESVRAVLTNSVERRVPIAIFDGGDRNILTALGIVIFHPIAFFFLTPFFRPFKLSRLLFTYLIPLIPFCTIWDGVVSIMRLYHPNQLEGIAREIESSYIWKSGKVRNRFGMRVAYLIGYPQNSDCLVSLPRRQPIEPF